MLWLTPNTAGFIRAIERSCSELLLNHCDELTIDKLSEIAATFYTALFSVARRLTSVFRTANPTWIRVPNHDQERADASREDIERSFISTVAAISAIAAARISVFEGVPCDLYMNDSTLVAPAQAIDCVLTSPPYCTQIDYTAATRIELALIAPLIKIDNDDLRRRMIGTTMVPNRLIQMRAEWGGSCLRLLRAVHDHPSKASNGYYYVTHLDYFDKIFRAITNLSSVIRSEGIAILIVQDSFYKDVHNDLAAIIIEMAESQKLFLKKRADFRSTSCMSRINSRAAAYDTRNGSIESVLIFMKQ